MLAFLELLDTKEEKDRLELLYLCFQEPLFHVAYKMLSEEQKAEDMVQETYITMASHLNNLDRRAYEAMRKYVKHKQDSLSFAQFVKKYGYRECGRAWNYIVTILKNKIYNSISKDKKEVIVEDEWFERIEDGEEQLIDILYEKKVMRGEIVHLLKELDPPYRDVLYLRYYNELSMEAIASLLNKTPENIRQIAKRGREKLRIRLEKGDYYEV